MRARWGGGRACAEGALAGAGSQGGACARASDEGLEAMGKSVWNGAAVLDSTRDGEEP
jgi:hypothetical protein